MTKLDLIKQYINDNDFREQVLLAALNGDRVASVLYAYILNGLVYSEYLGDVRIDGTPVDIPWRALTFAAENQDSVLFPNKIIIGNDLILKVMNDKKINFLRDDT